MYYSQVVWELFFKERLHPDEIVTRVNVPLITEQYVNTVIKNNRFLRQFPGHNEALNRRPKYDTALRVEIRKRRKQGLRTRPKRLDAKWAEKKDLW